MPNDDFTEVIAVLHVDERRIRLCKVKDSIDDGFDAMLGNKLVHRGEVGA